MSGGELALAVALSILAGGWIGCCLDRWRRRPPADEMPKRYVSDVRMNRLHVIQDELVNPRRDEEDE